MGYWSFSRFITPSIITILYALGAVLITLFSLIIMVSGSGTSIAGFGYISSGITFGVGFVLLVIGNLIWRVACEYLVVQFKIYGALVSIDRKTNATLQQPPTTKYCAHCGQPLTQGSIFCPICGTKQ